MLEAIPADEVDLDGRALAVRYKAQPDRPDLLVVDITAHSAEGTPTYVRRAETILIAVREPMSADAMRARVEGEAERRHIGRVAWIREA